MSSLLEVDPIEIKFPFELKKQISCSMQLLNKTDDCIAFKVKTTSPKKYCVRPNSGIVLPRSTCDVTVTMQAQKESPPDMQCKDKFLLQSAVVKEETNVKDVTPEMFNKDSGNVVDELRLKVIYVPPPKLPSPVLEESEEGSSPRHSATDEGSQNASELISATKAYADNLQKEKPSETSHAIAKLTEEKAAAVQQNNKLRQELELMRREVGKQRGGFSLAFVVIMAFLGILVGYMVKKT